MGNWTFAHPALLLIAPVAILAVAAAARHSTVTLPAWRNVLSGIVRGLALLFLTLSMVGVSANRRREQPFLTVFLADVSESVPREAWDEAIPELRRAWGREISAGNRCALVAFAGRASVLAPPVRSACREDFSRLSHRAEADRLVAAGEPSAAALAELRVWAEQMQTRSTDLARGLSAARALFQEDASNRIVLLTDGRTPLRPARETDFPPGTCVVRLQGAARQDVAVTDVSAPLVARVGEPFDVRVTLHCTMPGEASVRLWVDDEPGTEMEQSVTLPSPGRHSVLLKNVQQRRSLTPKLQQIRVLARAPGDADPRNNMGVAAVTVTGKPRVLLVEGADAEAEPLARLLQAQDIEFVREPAGKLSERATLEEFVAVILAGVPREALGPEVARTLSGYVSESGGGLWVVCSAALQGEHGYAKSDFEKLLPVSFTEAAPPSAGTKPDPAAKEDQPPRPPPPNPNEGATKTVLSPTLALLFLVDKSGSMAGDPIALVKQACIGSAQLLDPKDYVGVLAFDVKPQWILGFTEGDRQKFIEESVRRLYASGGTHIYPAMVEALRAFKNDARARQCAVKHAVLLSDGVTLPADFEAVTRKMADEGITVSTVCVGFDEFNAPLMSRIAEWGNGRFFFADSFKKVPQLFLQETKKVLDKVPPRNPKPAPAIPPPQPQPGPSPTPPTPAPAGSERIKIPVVVREPHEILRGVSVSSLPELRGKLGAVVRAGKAEVPLATPQGEPVLALSRVGLGKVAVWMSDLSGSWSSEWLPWKDTGKLFAQLVRHLYSATPDAEIAARVSVTTAGTEARVRIDPGPPDERITLRDERSLREFPLHRAPEGGWDAAVPFERAGSLQRLTLERGDGKRLTLGAGRAYEVEFAPVDADHDLSSVTPAWSWATLEQPLSAAKVPAERRQDFSPWAVLAALVLLPLDVALRRFSA